MAGSLKNIFEENEALDSKSYKFLISALERSNIEGFDYLEFKQSLSALRDLKIDEHTAIKSAYATASTMGLTVNKLVKSAAHYKSILVNEKSQFDEALDKQIKDRIVSRRAESEKLQKDIAKYEEHIQKLKAEIAACQEKIKNTDKDINEAEERIMSSKAKFESTFNEIVRQIEEDIEKFNQSLA
jgi:flagellar motility protein MotE (MotC chaperone)